MSAETPSHPNYKLHKKLMRRRAIRESWPLLVWLGVAALGVWAYQTGGEFNRMRGIVSKPVETIAAPFTGKLVALPEGSDTVLNADGAFAKLEQGLFVEADKVVAKMDDGLLQAEIAAEKQKGAFDRAKLTSETSGSTRGIQCSNSFLGDRASSGGRGNQVREKCQSINGERSQCGFETAI